MPAFYNELDAYPAAWLETLISAGHVAPGRVERRSIVELGAADLEGFEQAHFFAGIGGWSHALRLAGWPDAAPVWTGSCPCQPFSAAGRRRGHADDRHLWPTWFRLIRQRRPAVVFGEQVASRAGLDWIDAVQADLEAEGYAVGALDLCAAGSGAPHARQRIYFVALADGDGRAQLAAARLHGEGPPGDDALRRGAAGVVANTDGRRAGRDTGTVPRPQGEARGGVRGEPDVADSRGAARSMGDTEGDGREPGAVGRTSPPATGEGTRLERAGESGRVGDAIGARLEGHGGDERDGNEPGRLDPHAARPAREAGATRGWWADVDWLPCRDGVSRPVEPGTFPLAHGVPQRVGRVRAYGNAIAAPAAADFIRAVLDVHDVTKRD